MRQSAAKLGLIFLVLGGSTIIPSGSTVEAIATGSARLLASSEDEDMISSAWRHAAVPCGTGIRVAPGAEGIGLDGGNQLRVTSGCIFGVKKAVFNSQDFATITVSSYEDTTLPPP